MNKPNTNIIVEYRCNSRIQVHEPNESLRLKCGHTIECGSRAEMWAYYRVMAHSRVVTLCSGKRSSSIMSYNEKQSSSDIMQ